MTCPFADQAVHQSYYELEIDINSAALTACMDASGSADEIADETADLMEKLVEGMLDGEYEDDAIVGTSFALSANHICPSDDRRRLRGWIWRGGGSCRYCDDDDEGKYYRYY
jgi:hypothetical protein